MRERGQILKPGFAGNLLRQKPFHLLHRALFGEPGKQRVILSRTVLFELLKPSDEFCWIRGGLGGSRCNRLPAALEKMPLNDGQACHFRELFFPVCRWKSWIEAKAIEPIKPKLQIALVVHLGRTNNI